nr:hypothetical protein [uncultured Draconibacterium sp.]
MKKRTFALLIVSLLIYGIGFINHSKQLKANPAKGICDFDKDHVCCTGGGSECGCSGG